jgi:hypothetical protein
MISWKPLGYQQSPTMKHQSRSDFHFLLSGHKKARRVDGGFVLNVQDQRL